MAEFEADVSEPQEIVRLIGQTVHELEVKSLNSSGWPDYVYMAEPCYCHGSKIFMTERKTWNDLVNGIDDVEKQLARYLDLHPGVHAKFLLEGVVEPAAKGILVYSKNQGQNVMRSGLRGNQQNTYEFIQSWLHQVGKYWEVVQTATMAESAIALVTHFKADNKVEDSHSTFHRMFKTRNYTLNEQAELILNAAPRKLRFGPSQAIAVQKHFLTAWRAWKADAEEWFDLPGIGEGTARQYLRGIGRPDV